MCNVQYAPSRACHGSRCNPFHLQNAGFGNYLARPLFRERHRPDMSEAEAEELLKEGLKVCNL